MRHATTIAIFLAAGLGLASHGAWAQDRAPDMSGDWWACVDATEDVAATLGAPDQLLTAVALNETGRRAPNGNVAPWPWTINVGGQGYVFATKEQAVFAAQQLINSGTRSFDVGCMQVNVFFHPRAFTSFEEAFDPLSNVMYAASYIERLRQDTRSWDRAVELYHSYTEEYNQIYGARFQNHLSIARRRAAQGDALMSGRDELDEASRTSMEIDLVGRAHDGGDYTALLDERAARFGARPSSGETAAELPMVAALLASYGSGAPIETGALPAALDVRTAAIVRRFDQTSTGEAES